MTINLDDVYGPWLLLKQAYAKLKPIHSREVNELSEMLKIYLDDTPEMAERRARLEDLTVAINKISEALHICGWLKK